MANTREIITCQVGNYSNFIGAHFFNIQEGYYQEKNVEINNRVLWRESSRVHTPRAIIFDVKNNWDFLPGKSLASGIERERPQATKDNKKQLDIIQNNIPWEGPIQRIEKEQEGGGEGDQIEKQYQSSRIGDSEKRKSSENENEEKKSGIGGSKISKKAKGERWTDMVHWSLHNPEEFGFSISNLSHNPNLNGLSNYGQGVQIYSSLEDDITDAIRKYAEECDYLEGFHLLVDQNDGFGGLSNEILVHISDEYDKKTRICFGTSPPIISSEEDLKDFRLRMANTAMTWSSFNQYSSTFTSIGLSQDLIQPNPKPVSFPHFKYNPSSHMESSLLLAATLDNITSTYRVQSDRPTFRMREFADFLNAYGHKMSCFATAFPFPLEEGTLFEALKANGLSPIQSITPGISFEPENSTGNFIVGRGIPFDRVIRPYDAERIFGNGINNVESCLEVYTQEACPQSLNVVKSLNSPFKLSHPFPDLFDQTFLKTHARRTTSLMQGDVWELATMSSAHNSLLVGGLLERMIDEAGSTRRMNNFFLASEIEIENYAECINDLHQLREKYV